MISPVGRHSYVNAAVHSITTPTASNTQASSQKKRRSSLNKPKSREKHLSPRYAKADIEIAMDHIVNSGLLSHMQNYQLAPTS